MVAVCDAYEAIITDRCYRSGRSHTAARAELQRYAGHQFDPAVIAAFLDELETPTISVRTVHAAAADERAELAAEIAGRVREMVAGVRV